MSDDIHSLRIMQQNLNCSLLAQQALLHSIHPSEVDILLLQEPHIDHLNLSQANSH